MTFLQHYKAMSGYRAAVKLASDLHQFEKILGGSGLQGKIKGEVWHGKE